MAVKQGVYGGVSAADRKIARRVKLLDATLEVWGREGGPPVTMTRVCAEAGLTERYFYESFTGLDQAQIAVMERVAIVESASLEAVRAPRAQMLRQFVELAAHEARELYGPQAWSEAEGRLAATMFIGGLAELVTTWIEGTLEASPVDIVDAATHHFTSTAHR